MKKLGKKDHINLFFSAFLVLAFIICAYFFSGFSSSMDVVTGQLVMIAVYAVFGLLLFYATRVGDGKAVFRFSPLTLVFLVLPTVAIIVASLAPFMPFHDVFAANKASGQLSVITTLAAVALGYGIPYTFVSGFELAGDEKEEAPDEADPEVLEGGVEADLQDDAEAQADKAADDLGEKGYSLDTFDTDKV